MKMIFIFIIATTINVILSTIRSLCTINASKVTAAFTNAICYGFYTWVVVLTVSDISLWIKVTITAIANFLGVFIVKLIEEKSKKPRLWKVEMAIPKEEQTLVEHALAAKNISYNYIDIKEHAIFNCYCETRENTAVCITIAKNLGCKISAYESQNIL